MPINSFKDLVVWQKSMEFIPLVYKITYELPDHERYALSDQLRRAVISIPSNIAEGSKRSSRADFRQFCKVSNGSAAEVETQLLAIQLLYPSVNIQPAIEKLTEVQKMLTVLAQSLSKKLSTTT